ncbi:MAG TPA: dissimilatory sulfite reductase D family protein [Anaerolineae bacterium]|nr:dissimilatory sulfite reductase D family protein [Anaerolineae bacterium]
MGLSIDEQTAKDTIIETLTKKKDKTKFYLKDFYKMFPDENMRDVKKIVNQMVREELLEYWSSGSTTLIGLKGLGKQHSTEEDE